MSRLLLRLCIRGYISTALGGSRIGCVYVYRFCKSYTEVECRTTMLLTLWGFLVAKRSLDVKGGIAYD